MPTVTAHSGNAKVSQFAYLNIDPYANQLPTGQNVIAYTAVSSRQDAAPLTPANKKQTKSKLLTSVQMEMLTDIKAAQKGS